MVALEILQGDVYKRQPLGSALLNRFPGDTFCYEAPGGLVKCKILCASQNPLGLYLDRIILPSLNKMCIRDRLAYCFSD